MAGVEMIACVVCRQHVAQPYTTFPHDSSVMGDGICPACHTRYPASLLKAACDPFSYAMKLVTGEVLFFESARIDGDWVHLTLTNLEQGTPPPLPFERGVDVRASAIAWCADAPYGS